MQNEEKVFIAPVWVNPEFKGSITALAERWGISTSTLVRLLLIRAIQSEKIATKKQIKTWKK
jgi:antitoxin component of RelBE/YafQ-DinJ toxin-antitoxin module